MEVFAKGTSLGDLGASGFSLSTYNELNVLHANSVDGWWIYKYYQKHVPMEQRMWHAGRSCSKLTFSTAGAQTKCVCRF